MGKIATYWENLQKREKVIIGATILVLVLCLTFYFLTGKNIEPTVNAKTGFAAVDKENKEYAAIIQQLEAIKNGQEKLEADFARKKEAENTPAEKVKPLDLGTGQADGPMTPSTNVAGGKDSIKRPKSQLGMIYMVGEEQVAVIGGRQFHVGDKLGDSAITSMTLDYVEFETGGKKWKMYVSGNEE